MMKKICLSITLGLGLSLSIPSLVFAADTFAPRITSASLSRSSVNIRKHDKVVTLTLEANDTSNGIHLIGNDSGINASSISARLTHSSKPRYSVEFGPFTLVNFGSSYLIDGRGIYQASTTIPKKTKTGRWILTDVVVKDNAGNTSSDSVNASVKVKSKKKR